MAKKPKTKEIAIDTEDSWSGKDLHRPKLFKDFIGQELAVDILQGQLKTGKLSRQYLITGNKGDGKTSLARVLAMKINGTKEYNHPNISYMNAAVKTGVDDVRAMLKQIMYAPLVTGKRTLIVDEVHKWSGAAGSAILADLENPPEHVVFIFCTNEPEKLLQTMKDRCKKIEMRPLQSKHIKEILMNAANRENVFQPVEDYDDMFKSLATVFVGRNRDALNTLSNIANVAAIRKVTADDINALIKEVIGVQVTDIPKFLAYIYKGENEKAFNIAANILEPGAFTYGMLDLNSYLLKTATGLKPPFHYGGNMLLKNLKGVKTSVPKINAIQRVLIDMRKEVTYNGAVSSEALLLHYCVKLTEIE